MTEDANRPRGHKILLADDNHALQDVVKRVAERRGHVLVQATTGAAAVAAALAEQPDIIVLDMEFPDTDGREVLRRLKGEPRTAHIPVYVWSGRHGHSSDSRISLDLGAEAFLEKTDAQQLVRQLEQVLGPPKSKR
jgi:CheY-like chemotaxis protein